MSDEASPEARLTGPRIGIEDVTPALAREWLRNRVQGNRPIDPAHVDRLRRGIERDGYDSRDVILFDAAGALLNGQHRVTAISLMPDGFAARVVSADVNPPLFAGEVADFDVRWDLR